MDTPRAQESENGLMETFSRESTRRGSRLDRECLFVSKEVGATLENGCKEKCADSVPAGG